MQDITIPLYTNNGFPQKDDGTLFHFTSAESFFKILEDLTLKVSSFQKLNDLNEGNIHNFDINANFEIMNEAQKIINEQCSTISFSKNYLVNDRCIRGTNHPAMWAHYANNSDGVCIVIDKNKFMTMNNKILKKYFHKFEDIEYSFKNSVEDSILITNTNSPEKFIQTNYKHLFFRKHIDWEHEGEHRLFLMGYTGKFNIKGCIKYIVLGAKFCQNNDRMEKLTNTIFDNQSVCYQYFSPHSFAFMSYHRSGYIILDCAHKIKEYLSKSPNISFKK